MKLPCDHSTESPSPDTCRVCDLYVNNKSYRAYWDTKKGSVARRRPFDCVHMGKPTGEWRECGGG